MIKIGDIVKVDEIECTVFYIDEEKIYAIDNHGAGYYYNGIEDTESNALTYEWGAYNINVGTNNSGIGGGILDTQIALANENCFIPQGNGNKTIWSVLKELREQRNSNRWFIGNESEHRYFYSRNIDLPPNINTAKYYWTSTSYTSQGYAMYNNFTHSTIAQATKNSSALLRLMCTFTEDEISNDVTVKISHSDEGEIRYTKNGNDPDETSSLYESPISAQNGEEIKARVYQGNNFIPSDVASVTIDTSSMEISEVDEIPDGAELQDGIICYDRGYTYGEYNLSNGKLTRLSPGIDDGSPDSDNWRFLVMAKQDLPGNDHDEGNKIWGPNVKINITNNNFGYGKENTDKLLVLYGDNSDYLWYQVKVFRELNGDKWFVPSSSEGNEISDKHFPSKNDYLYFSSNENTSNAGTCNMSYAVKSSTTMRVVLMYRI